jgi:hypothetical protein
MHVLEGVSMLAGPSSSCPGCASCAGSWYAVSQTLSVVDSHAKVQVQLCLCWPSVSPWFMALPLKLSQPFATAGV